MTNQEAVPAGKSEFAKRLYGADHEPDVVSLEELIYGHQEGSQGQERGGEEVDETPLPYFDWPPGGSGGGSSGGGSTEEPTPSSE